VEGDGFGSAEEENSENNNEEAQENIFLFEESLSSLYNKNLNLGAEELVLTSEINFEMYFILSRSSYGVLAWC